jgi:hypothetical protein
MAQLSAPFNAQQFDPTQGGNFKPLMLGKYPVIIVASEVKANKDNTGGQVLFEVQATAGEHTGKTGQWTINLYHADETTRSIAEKTLSAICHATGQFMLTDTQALHNLPFALDVVEQNLTTKQQEDKANGKNVTPFRNVRVLMPDGSEVVAHGQQAQPQQQQPAQTAGGWGAPAGQQPAQTPAQQPAAGGWSAGAGQVQQPAQTPAAGGWAQGGAAAGGQPAWGKK